MGPGDVGRQRLRNEAWHEPLSAPTQRIASRLHQRPALATGRAGRACERFAIALGSSAQREAIYRMRHAVYAEELGQHAVNTTGRLTDALDAFNHYIVLTKAERLIGFVSITPPGHGRYSIDKYISRKELPFEVDDQLFEVRLLTVDPRSRGSAAAGLLMYAAFRWVEENGGHRIVIIGRSEVAGLYERVGLRRLGRSFRSGAVTYELMAATTDELNAAPSAFSDLLRRLAPQVDWRLTIPLEPQPGAFHGGVSHELLGVRPDPSARAAIVSADVLDAWFPPAPGVRRAACEDFDFSSMTSPPTWPHELEGAIAEREGVDKESILLGAGLSDLVYRCLPLWLDRNGRVLLVAPQYGEYRHVLEAVVGCQVDVFWFDTTDDRLAPTIPDLPHAGEYDWVFLVDPNNPLGYGFEPAGLADALAAMPASTCVWLDRTYAPYADTSHIVERLAASSPNIVVGKSMSKAWALSGLRVGYLCGARSLIESAARVTPPWCVSRPAQAGALAALEDPAYYELRYEETASRRAELLAGLARIPGVRPHPGVANFVFCWLDAPLDAATVVENCATQGVYLRSFPAEPELRDRAFRVAVRDFDEQQRTLQAIAAAVDDARNARTQAVAGHDPLGEDAGRAVSAVGTGGYGSLG